MNTQPCNEAEVNLSELLNLALVCDVFIRGRSGLKYTLSLVGRTIDDESPSEEITDAKTKKAVLEVIEVIREGNVCA